MFPLLLQTVISNQMRPQRLRGLNKLWTEWWRHLANVSEVFIGRKIDGEGLEKERKNRWKKNFGKYMHKLNKQQRERLHHIGNWFELFCLPKNRCEINFWWIGSELRIENREASNIQKVFKCYGMQNDSLSRGSGCYSWLEIFFATTTKLLSLFRLFICCQITLIRTAALNVIAWIIPISFVNNVATIR